MEMDLNEFFADYSLPTLIVSVTVAIFIIVADKFLTDKIPQIIINIAPFIIAIILYFAYDIIFVCKCFLLRVEALYSGILCASFAHVIRSVLSRISKGKPIGLSTTILMIESILSSYVIDPCKTASDIDNLLSVDEGCDLILQISEIIKLNLKEEVSEEQLLILANLVVKGTNSIKKKKKQN